jgi:hypothetical protein
MEFLSLWGASCGGAAAAAVVVVVVVVLLGILACLAYCYNVLGSWCLAFAPVGVARTAAHIHHSII